MWKVARHTTLYLPSTALGAFMNVAHPWIAQGVAEHSRACSATSGDAGIPEELQPTGFDDMLRTVENAAATDVFAASEASVRIVRFLLRHIPVPVRPMFRGFLGEVVPEPMLAVLGLPARSRLGRVHFRVVRRTLWLFNRLSPPSIRYASAARRLSGSRWSGCSWVTSTTVAPSTASRSVHPPGSTTTLRRTVR